VALLSLSQHCGGLEVCQIRSEEFLPLLGRPEGGGCERLAPLMATEVDRGCAVRQQQRRQQQQQQSEERNSGSSDSSGSSGSSYLRFVASFECFAPGSRSDDDSHAEQEEGSTNSRLLKTDDDDDEEDNSVHATTKHIVTDDVADYITDDVASSAVSGVAEGSGAWTRGRTAVLTVDVQPDSLEYSIAIRNQSWLASAAKKAAIAHCHGAWVKVRYCELHNN
jgi:hypothetical protein